MGITNTSYTRGALAAAFGLSIVFSPNQGARAADGVVLPGASSGVQPTLTLINDLASENRRRFAVFEGQDSPFNHGFPSGFFPGGPVLSRIHLDTACVYDPASPNGCTTDATRLDRDHGTVMRISFDPLGPAEFVGINIEEPENFGVSGAGAGYDLRGATRLCLDALSPSPGFAVRFVIAQHPTPFVSFPAQWTSMCFELATLGLTSNELSEVHFLFTIVSNGVNAPSGGTVLLDNIRFEPVPTTQQNAISFPLANQVFGVVPVPDALPGRVRIPPDQILPNLTTIYESSLAILALLGSGTAQDLESARTIADALVYALDHENQGDPIPTAPDGSAGLHNGMFGGDLPLFNDQGPGAGLAGQIRLPGFSIASNLCGPSHFCLVLDGATGGNNAFVILALTASFREFGDLRYLDAARTIGNWIYGNLLDTSGTGYGGYVLGYPDEGQPKQLITGKSIENNADIFSAYMALADVASESGMTAEGIEWTRRAAIAGDFVMQMFDASAGRFYAGTVPAATTPSPGITPDGPRMGDDVINTFDFLDAETFSTLALAGSQLYRNAIDWRRPTQWVLDRFVQSVTSGGDQFQGFNLVDTPTEGPNGIAWEFTAQAIVTFRFVDALYGESRFESAAQLYLDQLRQAQQSAPFADGKGLVAATLEGGDLLPPYEHCLSTPFQCVASRVGLAATTWAVFADLDLNPFDVNNSRAPDSVPSHHTITGVLDGAEFGALISPGSIVSVFGSFAEATSTAISVPLRTNVNGFSVTFDGKPGALFGVFGEDAGLGFHQANVQVPWDVDVSDGKIEVKVHWEDESGQVWSEPFEVDAGLASPGIFQFPIGSGQGIVTNFKLSDDDEVVAGSFAQPPGSVDPVVGQPAAVGGVVTIWCNGLGPVSPEPPTGGLPSEDAPATTKTVRVTIGGQQAQVLGAVLHPTNVGLNQINVFVPDGVTPGDKVAVVIEVDCGDGKVFSSRADVTIAVRAAP